MARFLFVTWDGGGNQPPAIGIAQELRERGHEVTFAGYTSQRDRFAARGFPFTVLERSEEARERAAAGEPWTRLQDGTLVCAPQLDEVPEVVRRERADAVIVDCMLFAAIAACEVSHLPAAVFVHSPPGALFHPNRILAQRVPAALNALRASVGLAPVEHLWDNWHGMTVLCATIPELDPLAGELPPDFDYVGPIFERLPPSGWHALWPRDDPRPLILVSFSTGSWPPQRSRIERTLAGLAGKSYRVLVTTSGADVSGIEAPANADLVERVPHAEVLPGAAAAVTHAGHGTISASLAHGVPLVCLPNPLIADQVPLAAQVERLGAGRALDGEVASAEDIARAVDAVLADHSYAAAAGRLAAKIAATSGAMAAATRLERLAEDADT